MSTHFFINATFSSKGKITFCWFKYAVLYFTDSSTNHFQGSDYVYPLLISQYILGKSVYAFVTVFSPIIYKGGLARIIFPVVFYCLNFICLTFGGFGACTTPGTILNSCILYVTLTGLDYENSVYDCSNLLLLISSFSSISESQDPHLPSLITPFLMFQYCLYIVTHVRTLLTLLYLIFDDLCFGIARSIIHL